MTDRNANTGPRHSAGYIGRFAPSPTGPLHFGSLVAAIGSYLDARHVGGRWLLRIEDLDRPRCVPGATESIMTTLAHFGLDWDGDIVTQSQREEAYRAAFEHLQANAEVFPCACSRREIADSAIAPDGSRIYPGTCRNGLPQGRTARAWRVRVDDAIVVFEDRVQGPQRECLGDEVGDFVVFRADGQYAYQLAVIVDDAAAGVTDVVRGADLLNSTGRQLHLQRLLGITPPRYAHLPVVVNAAGEKLSKQTLAAAVDPLDPGAAWLAALRFLGQNPPDELETATLATIRDWAVRHWNIAAIPARIHSQASPFVPHTPTAGVPATNDDPRRQT